MLGVGIKRGAVVFLFIILFIFVFANLAKSYVQINFPPGRDLGRFLQDKPLTADFNITFDYPFPLGPGETTLTTTISGGGFYDEGTIEVRPLLERYGVVYNGKYVYKPRFFDYDITLTGRNVTYEGIAFGYTITQTRVPPAGLKGDRKWKIQGRWISDSDGDGSDLKNKYCSGPWDFNSDVETGTGYLCDSAGHKTSCGTTQNGGNGAETWCCDDGDCISVGESDCSSYPDGSCPGPTYTGCPGYQEVWCCIGALCAEVQEPDCTNYDGSCDGPGDYCPFSFLPGTRIQLPEGTKNIEDVKKGDEVLSFENGEIVKRKVSLVLPPHESDHYYLLKTENREVKVTGNHEFYVGNNQFRRVEDLEEGDEAYVLVNEELVPEEIVYKEFVEGEADVYDLVVDGTHTFFANGFAVHNRMISFATGDSVNIQRLTRDPDSTAPINAQSILYYEDMNSKDVPNEPGATLVDNLYCQLSHSWLFEAYLYPSLSKTSVFRIYPDNGARVYLDEATTGGSWQNINSKICLDGCDNEANKDRYSGGCKWSDIYLEKDKWYRFRVYLFNNPGGSCTKNDPPTGNPMGIRIVDVGSPDISLLDEIGGETAVINSETPGKDKTISGSSRVGANEGLKEIVDVSAFSVEYTVTSDNPDVTLRMMKACGNSMYDNNRYTDHYGWIKDRVLQTWKWSIDGNQRSNKPGGGQPGETIPSFDESSVIGVNRDLFRPDDKEIGGIYKCKDKDQWPTWAGECSNPRKYIDETHNRYCCRKPDSSLVLDGDKGEITIKNYEEFYTYIMNYLPGSGPKLCAHTEDVKSETPINYVSRFNNTYCDEDSLQRCCYCTKDFGCTLECPNQDNISGSYFPPPFDMLGPGWEVLDLQFDITPSDDKIEFDVTGDSTNGWNIQASMRDVGTENLYKNYTIPVNLYDDFGFMAPSDTGTYNVVVTLNFGTRQRQRQGTFEVVECMNPGEKSTYYDEQTYPGTKNVGICRPGTRKCGSDNMWFYETKYDEPVYPESYEDCDGEDDDCNGIVDDIGGFDNIIREFINSGGKKTPKQITRCGCFGGANPTDEICNNIDDDCDGTIDNSEKDITINTCDIAMIQCEGQGNPYTWCLFNYNSSECSLEDVTFDLPNTTIINTCTEDVKKCLGNERYNNVTGTYEAFTYDDCKHLYQQPNCLLEEIEVKTLANTCYCSGGVTGNPAIITENCNGVDDNCNGIIDDVGYPETCACAFADINRTLFYKSLNDYSCNGIDSDCNGVIDDLAALCACRGRTPKEASEIRLEGRDICDYLDNDCDGLIDEGFPNLDKPCGYGVCFGGAYVCNVYGDDEVCNTTVNPEDTYLGNAFNFKSEEACDLKDNDCDGSIDEENCICTPSDVGISRICGYESGIYYNNRGEIDDLCNETMTQISKLISWAEAPGNTFYRRLMIIKNEDDFDLENYPVGVPLDTGSLVTLGKLRTDGGDLRITERGKEQHIDWVNMDSFYSNVNKIWFRVNIPKNSEKDYYLYYGDPSATYSIPGASSVIGLPKLRETLFLCHFDDTTECEGNMIAAVSNGVSYAGGKYEKGVSISSSGLLKYPTSENINKERGSIGLWVKPNDVISEHYLFYMEDFYGESQFKFYFDSDGTYFEVYDSYNNKNTVRGNVLNTEWNHLAVTWDVLYGIKLYMNGELVDTKSITWSANDLGTDMYLASMGSTEQLDGVMDEFSIYSKALSPEEVKRDVREYEPEITMGAEENLNQTITITTTKDIYLKCTQFLQNVTQTLTNESVMYTILSLCDSVRICNKTFPINSTSVCMIGTQTCSNSHWSECTGILPTMETCNNVDDDCNGIIDDVANPETCACAYGGQPVEEECNGIDDNCNEMVDDVRGGNSKETTHCGCFGELVNITQKFMEPENPSCNGIDDNCNGVIDEGISSCACSYTFFNSTEDNITSAKEPEDCDRIDDDCNGILDDPYQLGGSAVGPDNYLGADCGPDNSRCAGGKYVCSSDGIGTVCDTMSDDGMSGSDLRVPEECNAIDDDCNVIIDDVWGEDSGDYCQCYQGLPDSDEVCDGKDNNCDRIIDNVQSPQQCACYINLYLNTTNVYTLVANITTIKTSSETCNNIDDNCNKKIDEGLELTCYCSGGFSGNPKTRPELCNGADDDCNGVIDDVTFSETCDCYNGSHSKGEVTETCDGSDNDCDGLIDEGWPDLGSSCGFGICAGGYYECTTDGSNVVCSTIGGSDNRASTEVCDGTDNDCNLVVDEGCPCQAGENRSCGIEEGECETGYQGCINGQWSNCIGGKGPQTEVCDGKDNNCDGIVDNVGGGSTPNTAKCGCYGGAAKADEICDAMDNDCDIIIDNVYGGTSIETSKCACFDGQAAPKASLEICNGIDDDCNGIIDDIKGEISVEDTKCGCFGGEPKTNEICDGIDNDCNAVVDDAWPNLDDTCGLGVCTGVYVCTEDGSSAICSGGSPSPEVYDGKDNDCNGIVDDVKGGPPVPADCGNGVCEAGETNENCPEDCEPGELPPTLPGTWILVFIAIIVIIIIVGVALTFLK